MRGPWQELTQGVQGWRELLEEAVEEIFNASSRTPSRCTAYKCHLWDSPSLNNATDTEIGASVEASALINTLRHRKQLLVAALDTAFDAQEQELG